jgi:hypothetical protein
MHGFAESTQMTFKFLISRSDFFLHEQRGEQGLLKLQAIHQVKDPEQNTSLRVTSKIFETGNFASSKTKFKKQAHFIIFSILSKKAAIILFVEKLKVNSILTSLAFCYHFSVLFRLRFLFLGGFSMDLLTTSSIFCQILSGQLNA